MLNCESERRLKNLLVAVAEGEQGLEIARQRLCAIRDFSPKSAFQRLDRSSNNYLQSYEILNFVREQKNFSITEAEAYRLVKFFDSEEMGRLTFQE